MAWGSVHCFQHNLSLTTALPSLAHVTQFLLLLLVIIICERLLLFIKFFAVFFSAVNSISSTLEMILETIGWVSVDSLNTLKIFEFFA